MLRSKINLKEPNFEYKGLKISIMIMINWLIIIFYLVFIIAAVKVYRMTQKEDSEQEKTNKKSDIVSKRKKKDSEKIITLLIQYLAIILVAAVITGILVFFDAYKISALIIIFITFVFYINDALASVSILGNIIKENNNDKLSLKEQNAIVNICYIILCLGISGLYNWMEKIIIQCPITIISNTLILLLYIILSFVYIFFILAILPIPIFCSIKFLKKIKKDCLLKNN